MLLPGKQKIFLISILLLNYSNVFADIYDYIYPVRNDPSFSNYGTTGLIQNPTARFMEEGSLALNWSHLDPYIRGSLIAYPFSWFEASYQYTDINNALYSDIKEFSGNQSYKDKSFDVKFKLLNETDILPAVAVGFRDLAGTGVFSSEYIVGSKRFSNVDLSLGIGWGAMSAGSISNPLTNISERFESRTNDADTLGGEVNVGYIFSGDMGFFGGVEIFLPNIKGLRLKVEYDSIDYKKEGFPFGPESFKFATKPVRQNQSRINAGLVYPVNEKIHLKASFIKGNTFSIGFSIQSPLGRPNSFVKKKDPPVKVENPAAVKVVTNKNNDLFYKASLSYLNDRGFYLQAADIEDDTFHVVYAQSKFKSFGRSGGRVLRVLDEISPDYIKNFKVTNINADMGMHTIEMNRKIFIENEKNNLFPLTKRSMKVSPTNFTKEDFDFQPTVPYPTTFWKISPSVRSQIGGPDGFYFGDLRIAFHSETLFNSKITLKTNLSHGIYDNFERLKLSSDSILPHVRTDIVEYLKNTSNKTIIRRMQLNYFGELKDNLYYKISGGILEPMFSGIGGELLFRPFYSTFAVGTELWRVRQRSYRQLFEFNDYETTTGHINLFYMEPRSQVLIKLKGGRFLAGDSGINFDFSRSFKSGLRIGAFFSLTDISKAEFGEGSFDKGFYFYIPIETFFERYSKGNTGFGLRPITRDGAAYLSHGLNLYGVTDQAVSSSIYRDIDDIYD